MRIGVHLGIPWVVSSSRLDPATHDYLGQIRATGVTVTSTQQNAIDAFIVAEKAASRWDSHKRIYLPIWANAAANAICMKTCLSGTFVNSPTHASGYVQGNGSTSYFDSVVTWSTLIAVSSGFVGTLNLTGHQTANITGIGVGDTAGTSLANGSQNSGASPISYWSGASVVRVGAGTLGIQSSCRFGGVTRNAARTTAGVASSTSSAATSGSVIAQSIAIMARKNGVASAVQHTTARIGSAWISNGMDATNQDDFTSNLKTLWETCTGLTLP